MNFLNRVSLYLIFSILNFMLTDALTCNGVKCPMYSYCSKDKCMCTDVSSPKEKYCGSNGMTYDSKQELEKYACQNNESVVPLRKGMCYSCNDSRCHSFTECNTKINTCVCKPVPDIYSPVCGNDGSTYDSEYLLNYTSCMEQTNVTMIYKGLCKGPGVCGHHTCHMFSECDPVTNECSCKDVIDPKRSPVCGTNDRTYENLHALQVRACQQNSSLDLKHEGACNNTNPNQCGSSNCHTYSICNVTSQSCVCPPKHFDENHSNQVCASDGILYKNEFVLRRTICLTNSYHRFDYNRKPPSCAVHLVYTVTSQPVTKLTKPSIMKRDNTLFYIIISSVCSFVLVVAFVLTIICCCRIHKDKTIGVRKRKNEREYIVPLM